MFQVHIGYRFVRYTEADDRVLVLGWDWGGTPDSFWIDIPGQARWNRSMPAWARNRREEILDRVRQATAHMGFAENEL